MPHLWIYLRYYVGHERKFGHEFLEFESRPDGKLRYANNSNYKNDTMIRKEVFLNPAVLRGCRRIIADSEIMKEDDCSISEVDPGCRDIGVKSFNTTQYSGRGSGSNTQEKYHQLPQYSEGHSPCDGPSSPSPFSS